MPSISNQKSKSNKLSSRNVYSESSSSSSSTEPSPALNPMSHDFDSDSDAFSVNALRDTIITNLRPSSKKQTSTVRHASASRRRQPQSTLPSGIRTKPSAPDTAQRSLARKVEVRAGEGWSEGRAGAKQQQHIAYLSSSCAPPVYITNNPFRTRFARARRSRPSCRGNDSRRTICVPFLTRGRRGTTTTRSCAFRSRNFSTILTSRLRRRPPSSPRPPQPTSEPSPPSTACELPS